MRWFVEISSLGKNKEPEATLCVEAAQWQPALQKARQLRGDDGALSNFSIELLEEGYRAIDPGTRLRYVVKKAPDDAALTNGEPKAAPPKESAAPAKSTAATAKNDADPKNDAAPKSVPPASVATPSKKRGTAQTVAFGSKGGAVLQEALDASAKRAGVAAPADAPPPPPTKTQSTPPRSPSTPPPSSVPPFRTVSTREDEPSERSPLTYREIVYAVVEGTAPERAEELIRDRFDDLKNVLESRKAGKLVNLAVFDHVFKGRPQRPPIVTLTWKDWKGDEPEIRFPLRDGAGNTPTPLAPAASGPPPAPSSFTPSTPSTPVAAPRNNAAPAPVAAAPVAPAAPVPVPAFAAPVVAAPVPVATPVVAAPVPVVAAPVAPAPVAVAPVVVAPAAPRVVIAPAPAPVVVAPTLVAVEKAPAPIAVTKTSASAGGPVSAPQPALTPSIDIDVSPAPIAIAPEPTPPPAKVANPTPTAPITDADIIDTADAADFEPKVSSVPPPTASQRLSGDELIGELFEACSDLHFLQNPLDGADFVLTLTLEKLPSRVGLVSLFDMNKREFVVVRQAGGSGSAILSRLAERSPVAHTAMRTRHAVVVSDAQADPRVTSDPRWAAAGIAPTSVICAPVELGGRYLGLIEIADPLDGHRFAPGDGHALTYIGQQYAEFVAEHGITIDPEAVTQGPKKGRLR